MNLRGVHIVDAVRTPIVVHQLTRKGSGTGVATLCIGVGKGPALVLGR